MKKAEAKVRAFLQAWKDQNWLTMFRTTQLTWREDHGDERLHELFGAFPIEGYEIKKVEESSNYVVADVVFRVKVNGQWTAPAKARAICEKKAFTPDKYGTWGVNPTSALRIFNKAKV